MCDKFDEVPDPFDPSLLVGHWTGGHSALGHIDIVFLQFLFNEDQTYEFADSSQIRSESGTYEVVNRDLVLHSTLDGEHRRRINTYRPGRVMFWFEEINTGVVFKPTPADWQQDTDGQESQQNITMQPITDDAPSELQHLLDTLDAQIEALQVEKESAVLANDFDRAINLREQVTKLRKMKDTARSTR